MARVFWGLASLVLLAAIARGDDAARQSAAESGRVRYDGHMLVRIDITSAEDREKALAISQDHWSESVGIGPTLFRIPPGGLERLEAAGLKHEVVRRNIQEMIDAERAQIEQRSVGFFDTYRDFASVNAQIDAIVALRPDLAHKFSIGASLQGRTVYGVRISSAAAGARPGFLLTAGQHAREWISVMSAMYVADTLVRNYDGDAQIKGLVDAMEFIVIPVVNPDGYVYSWTTNRMWRKNRRPNQDGSIGVDLNRNWSEGWGFDNGSSASGGSDQFRGPIPFSEPETVHLRDFVVANPTIRAHIDAHSYSQIVLGAWGYTGTPALNAGTLIPLGWGLADAITQAQGAVYNFGTNGRQLGPSSGVMPDWAFGIRNIFSWTVELRDDGTLGFILPADQIVPTGLELLAGVEYLAGRMAASFEIRFPQLRPGYLTPGVATPLRVDIAPLSGAVQSGTPKLFARVGNSGAFTQSSLTFISGVAYQGTLPAAACGSVVEYYIQAASTGGAIITSPADAPANVHTAKSLAATVAFSDNFESDTGWVVGAPGDTATAGIWTRVDPVGTSAQPEDDNPVGVGTKCFVTGQGLVAGGVGDADVDNGATTLTSPPLDAQAMTGDAYVSYYRWFSNQRSAAPNSDSFPIDISGDDGAHWVNLETVIENTDAWVFRQWRIADFVTPTDRVRIRFVARDDAPASAVEAGVDDVSVTFAGCPGAIPADINADGAVNSSDLGLMLGAWGPCPPGGGCPADLNQDGVVNSSDLGLLLGDWG